MASEVHAVLDAQGARSGQSRLDPHAMRPAVPRIVAIVCVAVVAALISDRADWQPLSLVVALAATMIVADVMAVRARRVRISAGLMVQVVAMALLGPAPAVVIGILAAAVDAAVNRVRLVSALDNMAVFGFLGLVGGVLFDVLGAWFALDPGDAAYALLVVPVNFVVAALNLGIVSATTPGLAPTERRGVLRESGVPALPVEILHAVMAAAVVLVWAHAGLAAAAALLLVLVISIPLLRTVGSALRSGDDLLALRHVSDERAAEVARLASDRERLLSEVLNAEERERARLAESLHDGPAQRLAAMRQDVAEGASLERLAGQLDAALAETRAIISAYHPVSVRELGFEASLRAAISPFPSAATVELTVDNAVIDRFLTDTLLLPVAQELAVNAIKHADPSKIHMSVHARDGHIVLEVNDDGVGIDTSDAGRAVQAGHLGLAMVRRRVEDAGGVLIIETRPDGGTRSQVSLPATSV
jgi:two-component system, NarL family, sensor kinase